MTITIPEDPSILSRVVGVERIEREWSSATRAGAGLDELAANARRHAIAASARLAGIRVSDEEVDSVLSRNRDDHPLAGVLRGYAAALDWPVGGTQSLLATEDLRWLHAVMSGELGPALAPSPWRASPIHREEFDAAGRATGRVFATLPPRLVEETTEQLVTWLELELRELQSPPVLVVATFALVFHAISPFEAGNGRMTRLLAVRLLERIGFRTMRYASLEAAFEQTREDYYSAIDRGERNLWTDRADPTPWLEYFVEALERRGAMLGSAPSPADDRELSALQRAILDVVRMHGTVDAGLLLKVTGANRNTLKDNLRRMVSRGVLVKTGQRRGTRYRLADA